MQHGKSIWQLRSLFKSDPRPSLDLLSNALNNSRAKDCTRVQHDGPSARCMLFPAEAPHPPKRITRPVASRPPVPRPFCRVCIRVSLALPKVLRFIPKSPVRAGRHSTDVGIDSDLSSESGWLAPIHSRVHSSDQQESDFLSIQFARSDLFVLSQFFKRGVSVPRATGHCLLLCCSSAPRCTALSYQGRSDSTGRRRRKDRLERADGVGEAMGKNLRAINQRRVERQMAFCFGRRL